MKCTTKGASGTPKGMTFQASDVRRPLAAVARIVETGNRVQFGHDVEDNYIQNVVTGDKVPMRRKGRSYVIDVDFIEDEAVLASVFHRHA